MLEIKEIDEQDNDYVKIIGKPCVSDNSKIVIKKGGGNRIVFGNNVKLLNTNITFVGNGGELYIDSNCVLRGKFLIDKGGKITIGDNTIFNFATAEVEARDGAIISIGKDCLFSYFRASTSDVHSIFDRFTKGRVNNPKDIVISDRVWIAYDALILKGSFLACDSVVGARSVVSGAFPANVVIAGNPARIIKSDILWDTRSLDKLE